MMAEAAGRGWRVERLGEERAQLVCGNAVLGAFRHGAFDEGFGCAALYQAPSGALVRIRLTPSPGSLRRRSVKEVIDAVEGELRLVESRGFHPLDWFQKRRAAG